MGSATKVELTTVADCQSCLHRLVTSIDCKSLVDDCCGGVTSAVRQLVKKFEPVKVEEVAVLEEKLERCRCQENNPLSEL